MRNREFTITLILLLCASISVFLITRRGEPVVVATNLENIPMKIMGFNATKDSFPKSVYKALNADCNIYRHYVNPDGYKVDLYIGYYGTAKGGRTPHNPYACLPAEGWGIQKAHEIVLHPTNYSGGVAVNYIQAKTGESYETMLHWYQSDRNKVLRTGFEQNIQRFMGRVLRNRNDGAFVRVSVSSNKSGLTKADKKVRVFAEALLNILPQYWPTEQ